MKVRIKDSEFTYNQLLNMGRLPKAGMEGERRWTNRYCRTSAIYFSISDTYEADQETIAVIKQNLRAEKNKKRREHYKEQRKKFLEERAEKIARYEYWKLCYTQKAEEVNNPSGIVVCTIKTTGLYAGSGEILQISLLDGEENVLLDSYVKPRFISEWNEANKFHSITPNMVKEAPELWEIAGKVKGILMSANILIAYNVRFLLEFLDVIGFTIQDNQKVYDVMIEFAKVYGEYDEVFQDYKWQKLSVAAAYYGYELHKKDSLDDARAVLRCYNGLQKL